jgi:hypothetical protein
MTRVLFSLSVALAGFLFFAGSVLANDFVAWHSSNTNVTIDDDDDWVPIRSVTVNIPGGDGAAHGCVANASADVENPGPAGVENQYRFVVTRNNTNPATNSSSERIVEVVDNDGVDDPDSKSVSTMMAFTGLTNDNGASGSGAHTFYFLGRKVNPADSDFSVICVDTP